MSTAASTAPAPPDLSLDIKIPPEEFFCFCAAQFLYHCAGTRVSPEWGMPRRPGFLYSRGVCGARRKGAWRSAKASCSGSWTSSIGPRSSLRAGEALESLSSVLGGAGAVLVPLTRPEALIASSSMGEPAEAYTRHWSLVDPRAKAAFDRRLGPGVFTDPDLVTTEEMARDPFYQEFLRSFDLEYFASFGFLSETVSKGLVSVSIQRRRGRGPSGAAISRFCRRSVRTPRAPSRSSRGWALRLVRSTRIRRPFSIASPAGRSPSPASAGWSPSTPPRAGCSATGSRSSGRLSVETVRTHLKNINQKLGFRRQSDLVALAARLGMTQ